VVVSTASGDRVGPDTRRLLAGGVSGRDQDLLAATRDRLAAAGG